MSDKLLHSDGPWDIMLSDLGGGPHERPSPFGPVHFAEMVVAAPDGDGFAEPIAYLVDSDSEERNGANADLLCSAPTLAAALRKIYDELYDRYDGAPDSSTKWMASLINDAEKALHRAGLDPQ